MAPFKKMLLKADVNKIYDEEYQREQSAKDEKVLYSSLPSTQDEKHKALLNRYGN